MFGLPPYLPDLTLPTQLPKAARAFEASSTGCNQQQRRSRVHWCLLPAGRTGVLACDHMQGRDRQGHLHPLTCKAAAGRWPSDEEAKHVHARMRHVPRWQLPPAPMCNIRAAYCTCLHRPACPPPTHACTPVRGADARPACQHAHAAGQQACAAAVSPGLRTQPRAWALP